MAARQVSGDPDGGPAALAKQSAPHPPIRSYRARLLMITRNANEASLLAAKNAAGSRPGECSRVRGTYTSNASATRSSAPSPRPVSFPLEGEPLADANQRPGQPPCIRSGGITHRMLRARGTASPQSGSDSRARHGHPKTRPAPQTTRNGRTTGPPASSRASALACSIGARHRPAHVPFQHGRYRRMPPIHAQNGGQMTVKRSSRDPTRARTTL